MFELPAEFQKDLAPSSQKIYARYLNRLAEAGFDSVEKLKKASSVIVAIKGLTASDNEEKTKSQVRYYISAIFWVAKFPKKNAYYTFYNKNLPKDWVPKREM